jgi:hypothetical protein
MGVPAEEDGSNRWSLDHLFLDQDAVPTLVEVKRSSDSRLRREVVGQMLDYAANAVVYLPVEDIRARFEKACERRQVDAEGEISAFIAPESDVDGFWQRVKTNLQAGRVRMVFVADLIPPELQRIVEFLNGQMDPAEVLAVQIKQFVGQGLKTLVPTVIGRTARSDSEKGKANRSREPWDQDKFFGVLEARKDGFSVEIARKLIAWMKERNLDMRWGVTGFFVVVRHKQGECIPMTVRTGATNAYVEVDFGPARLMDFAPFDCDTMRIELLSRLRHIPGVSISDDAIAKYPSIRFSVLAKSNALNQFLECMDWVIGELKKAE